MDAAGNSPQSIGEQLNAVITIMEVGYMAYERVYVSD